MAIVALVFIAIAVFLWRVYAKKRARIEAEEEEARARWAAKAEDAARTFAAWRAKAIGVAMPDGSIMVGVKDDAHATRDHVVVVVCVDDVADERDEDEDEDEDENRDDGDARDFTYVPLERARRTA